MGINDPDSVTLLGHFFSTQTSRYGANLRWLVYSIAPDSCPLRRWLSFMQPEDEVRGGWNSSKFTQACGILCAMVVAVHGGLHQGMANRDFRWGPEPRHFNQLGAIGVQALYENIQLRKAFATILL